VKKVLLLNPPGKKLYIRDYFCSKVSQADYIHHPIDLVILSGILSQEFDITVIDSIACSLSAEETAHRIEKMRPNIIISLIGSVSLEEDTVFLADIKRRLPGITIVGIGDVFCENAEKFLKMNSFLDAILLDFTTDDIVRYLQGDIEKVRNMLFKDTEGHVHQAPAAHVPFFALPVPRHELFSEFNYRHPFVRTRRFATTIIDYGCPFKCSFCIMKMLGYKFRSVENVVLELKYIRSLGIKEILFDTQTFGANKRTAMELCHAIVGEKINIGWVCFSRVDVTSYELLDAMKKAGCHTIIFGVESGSDEILAKYHKGYRSRQILETIDYCHSIGIETVGTFILGLPDESRKTASQTLDLIKKIKLDYASFNVAVPRAGTELRTQALKLGFIKNDFVIMDQSGSTIALPTKFLSRDEVLSFRRKAVFSFYLRPSYIMNKLFKIRSYYDITRHFKHAYWLVKNTWFS